MICVRCGTSIHPELFFGRRPVCIKCDWFIEDGDNFRYSAYLKMRALVTEIDAGIAQMKNKRMQRLAARQRGNE